MPQRILSLEAIEAEFGALKEIEDLPSGGWNHPAIAVARAAGTLWTQVSGGAVPLISSGFHYVNRERYFVSERPVAPGDDICEEADASVTECANPDCGALWDKEFSPNACPECGGTASVDDPDADAPAEERVGDLP